MSTKVPKSAEVLTYNFHRALLRAQQLVPFALSTSPPSQHEVDLSRGILNGTVLGRIFEGIIDAYAGSGNLTAVEILRPRTRQRATRSVRWGHIFYSCNRLP